MKKILLSAYAILVLTTLQYGQNLGNEKLLYHTPDGVRWTQCALGPDGVLWVVWVPGTTNDNSGGPIYILSYDGTTVSTPFNLTNSGSIRANRPNISVSPKGYVVAAWGVVGTKSTYIRIWDPKTKAWLNTEAVNEGDGGSEPYAVMDKSGNIHVLFSDEAGGKVFTRSKINGIWENTVRLSMGYCKQGGLAVGSDGIVHAVWIEKTGSIYENYYTSRTATTSWKAREDLPKVTGSSNHPWVAVGPNNMPILVWQDITYPDLENGCEVRVKKLHTSENWETVIDFYMQHFPRVVVDNNNKIHVACQTGGGDYGSGLRYTNNVNGTWMSTQAIGASMTKIPGLAAGLNGNVAATMSSWTSGSNQTGTDIKAWSINPIQKIDLPEAEFTFSPTTGYPPLTVNFTAEAAYSSNGQEVAYDWNFGDGGTATGRTISHMYQASGTFNVTLRVTDNKNRTDEATQALVVKKTNPLIPTGVGMTITMARFWRNPEIMFNLSWAANPDNIPEHIEGYAIYMKEGTGDYTRLSVVSSSTLSASFPFNDLSKRRTFAVSTLGYGGTESPLAYFQ